ncbi:SMI1/KNR4 family protein [Corynebacterium uberis]|uniref:SMI1/KNR4 family protein n=1 Tax=Corynebacterium uberis TaxID=2883169 RepID=UPI001D0AD443|nr:SMI1/KNR4 family protein [Corynebacterium uberis]UDL73026.1 SMI1/KNR4 family protein [Corynebacterium uberis]UDL78309.1 SMI1/KNR4 family protein [Corynebacterium uberis]UDL80592.1 SMI1/KNR4 family protein [Corynebacterium uberis]UDL82727.1 SMI1/KNR4 family protein [Corynebacterium uberis]
MVGLKYIHNHFYVEGDFVRDVEKILGNPLPSEYREFLINTGGGLPRYEGTHDAPILPLGGGGFDDWAAVGEFSSSGDLLSYLDRKDVFRSWRWEYLMDDMVPLATSTTGVWGLGIDGRRRGKICLIDEEISDLELFDYEDGLDDRTIAHPGIIVAQSFGEFFRRLVPFKTVYPDCD